MAALKNLLDSIYKDPSSPAGFAGIDQLWREAKKVNPHIPREAIVDYLQRDRTYTLLKPKRVHFARSKTVPIGYLTDLQCDLADMQKLEEDNDGHTFILVGSDVLSRRVYATPLLSKEGKEVVRGFKELFKQCEMLPYRVYTDRGPEFTNQEVKKYFKKEDIQKLFPSNAGIKAGLAENCIKRLKHRIYRYFHEKHTQRWVSVLDQIVHGMNHAQSRALGGLRPVDVSFDNARQIRKRLYGPPGKMFLKHEGKPHKPRLKIGDNVRLSRDKHVFTKGYYPTFHDEILEVSGVKPGGPQSAYGVTRYKVKDYKNEPFEGYYYDQELGKVIKDANTSYRIEEVIKEKRGRDGRMRYFVKFLEYPDPEWIDQDDLV